MRSRQRAGSLVIVLALIFETGCERTANMPAAEADISTLRQTQSGEVVGFRGEYGSDAWLGIPYAAPPVELLRWREPKRPKKWQGQLQALRFGSPCVQYASPFGGISGKRGELGGSEDCLFLNIWAPRVASQAIPAGEQRWPVMFWIHGGGNSIGHAGFYNGGNLAATQNVVVVTANYRLGPLGWFRYDALREDATDTEASGNFATLDLIAALQWVRDNISSFGGDPNNVTIFGESAGGTNVNTLLLSPRAHGLFHRAISQSGGFAFGDPQVAENFADDPTPGDANSSKEAMLRLIQRDRISKDRAAAKNYLGYVRKQDQARYLRNKTAAEIFAAYEPSPSGMIFMPMVFRDGTVLPSADPYSELSRDGGYNRVPVMFGTNRDENKLFMFATPELVRRWLWIVPRLRDERMYNLSAEFLAKMWKARGADEPATAIDRVQGSGVYVYRFDWDEEPTVLGADLSMMLGAAHGFEIPFVFGHFDLGKEGNVIFTEHNASARQQLSAAMMSYWAQFARSGAPGRGRDGRLPEWKAWDSSTPSADKYMVLDTAEGGGLHMASETFTREGVIAAVASDARLSSAADQCSVYRDLANWGRGMSKDEYGRLTQCAAYPLTPP